MNDIRLPNGLTNQDPFQVLELTTIIHMVWSKKDWSLCLITLFFRHSCSMCFPFYHLFMIRRNTKLLETKIHVSGSGSCIKNRPRFCSLTLQFAIRPTSTSQPSTTSFAHFLTISVSVCAHCRVFIFSMSTWRNRNTHTQKHIEQVHNRAP